MLTLGAVTAAVFWPLIVHPTDLLSGPQRSGLNDLSAFVLPRREFTARCVTSFGELPFWNPNAGAGLPAIGSGQWAFFYPPNWLHVLLPSPAVLSWLLVAHHVFAGAGAMLLGRRYGFSWQAASLSGVAFLAAPYLLAHTGEGHFMHVCAVAWTPWAFLAYERFRAGGRLGVTAVAVTIALSFLAGHPQESYMLVLVLTACCAADIARSIGRGSHRDAVRLGGGWMLAGLATVGLVAMELIPNLVALRQSVRTVGIAAGDAGNVAGSIGWSNFRQLLNPLALGGPETYSGPGSFFWETLCYFGVVPLALALIAAFTVWSRPPTLRLAIIAAFAIAFAFGPTSVVFRLAHEFVPGLCWFRVPARSLFFAAFAVAMLAGAGLDVVVGRFCTELTTPRRRLGQIAGVVLGLLCVVELSLFAASVIRTVPIESLRSGGVLAERLRHSPEIGRVMSRQDLLSDREAWSAGVGKLQAYEPLVPSAWAEFGAALNAGDGSVLDFLHGFTNTSKCRQNLLDLLNVRHIVLPKPAPNSFDWRLIASGELVEPCALRGRAPRTAKYYLYENPTALPRAFMLGHASLCSPSDNPRQALAELNPRDRVLVEHDVLPSGPRQDFHEAEIKEYSANRVVVHAELDAAGYLVLSDAWYPGWTATVDGQPAPVFRANLNFRAVALSPGTHRVTMQFRPPGFVFGLIATCITLAIGCYAVARGAEQSRLPARLALHDQ